MAVEDEIRAVDTNASVFAPAESANPTVQTLNSIAALHAHHERSVTRSQRFIEAAIAWAGRPRFLFFALAFALVWLLINTIAAHYRFQSFDPPPFSFLQGLFALTSLSLTIMILIAQNRQAFIAERRGQLDLQINLLSDQKNAKIIELLEELRRDLPSVRDRDDPEATALQATADPEAMLVALDFILGENRENSLGSAADHAALLLEEEADVEALERLRAVS